MLKNDMKDSIPSMMKENIELESDTVMKDSIKALKNGTSDVMKNFTESANSNLKDIGTDKFEKLKNSDELKKKVDDVSNMLKDTEMIEKAKSMSSLDEIFDLVGLYEHPKAQEIKQTVMNVLESLRIVNNVAPPEQSLGEYLCECSTCTQTKTTFERESKYIIKKHYKLKRNDYEQAFKVQLQQYVDDNDATYNCDLDEMREKDEKEEKEKEEKEKKKQEEEKITPPKNSSVFPLYP